LNTRRTKTERLRTAHHEAGHAVIGRVLGLTRGGATIIPDYEQMAWGSSIASVGRSIEDWEARGRWRYVSMYRAVMMELMAGRESELVCLGCAGNGDSGHLDD
jgi:ATP-dependent Zn protease